jgi:hypothetical protein
LRGTSPLLASGPSGEAKAWMTSIQTTAKREAVAAHFFALFPALVTVARGLWIGPRYDRYVLPAFDGYVYDAMAEAPRIFTLPPWGYRILTPWIVHTLPAPSWAEGFYWLNLMLLPCAVFAVGAWLRGIGFSPMASFLAGMSLATTPPLGAFLDYQVLVDPLSLVVFVAILNELLRGGGLGLAALFAVGALAKEICLIPVAALPFVLAARMGWRLAVLRSAAIAAPAIALTLFLRLTWGSQTVPANGFSILEMGRRFLEIPAGHVTFFMVATVIGLRGLLKEDWTPIRALALLLWPASFLAVLLNPFGFAAPDLARIAPFAWTPFLPLTLAGLGLQRDATKPAPVLRGKVSDFVAIAALLGVTALAMGADSYRRAPEPASTEPVVFLARSRETLKTARALDEGQPFIFDAQSGRFAAAIDQTFNLTEGRRMRWFLYRGFEREATFGPGAPEFREHAELLVPIMEPRNATILFKLESNPEDVAVTVGIASLTLGVVRTHGSDLKLSVPRQALFRGDNVIRLQGPPGARVRLVRFEVHLEPRGPPGDR